MDDRSDFGTLEHSRLALAAAGGLYGPSAAVAVNSGLMQLPSLGDTAGRLGIMDGCPGLTPPFGCPPGLHADYSAMNSLAQLHGWYRPALPHQNSTYSDIFGSYVGPGGNWRNLSTPPTVSDHFHSPLPGMTHPVWPCSPTPVPCTEGCSLSYYNTPNMYSAYSSAYFSLMSSSTMSDYQPYLSPRFPGSMPAFQQRLHDRHRALMLASSAGGHRSPEFLSPWNPHMVGSSSVAVPLHSPGCLSASGQMAFGFSIDEGSSSNKSMSDEHKQSIKQEPVPSKMKVKGGPGDHKPRDNSKRDQHQSWGHSNVSNTELLPETKPGWASKKFVKDEKLHSPTTNKCSLDLRSNNNSIANITNNNNINSNITNHSLKLSSDIQSADDILSAETARDGTILADQKSHLRNLQISEIKESSFNESAKQRPIDNSCQEVSNECRSVVNELAANSNSLSADDELSEVKRNVDVLSVVSSASGLTPDTDLSKECQTAKDKVPHTDISSTSDLTCNSKMETELGKSLDLFDSPIVSKEDEIPYLVSSSKLINQNLLDNLNMTVNSIENSDKKNSCIIQHSLFFEEISNDGMDSSEKESQVEVNDVKTSESLVSAGWVSSFPTMSTMRENGQKSISSKKMESNSTSLSLVLPSCSAASRSSLSSESESSAVTSMCSPLSASFSLVSPSSQHTASSDFSSSSSSSSSVLLNTSTAAKSDSCNTFSHSIALTLYMDSSVKLPKTSVSDGLSSLSSQEIDLAMPRQSMRYQVSHHRQNPMQDGCKVHAPTFLPEVCTLPCNTITTITTSSSVSPALPRSTPSAKIGGSVVPSKLVAGQRSGRSQTKLRGSSTNNNAEVHVKMEKSLKFSPDIQSATEIKDAVTSGKNLSPNQERIQADNNSKRSSTSEQSQVDATSGHAVVPMDFSSSKSWSQSIVGGSCCGVLPSDYYLFRSSASQSHADPGFRSSKCFSSHFTMAELNTITSVTPALGKSTTAIAPDVRKSLNAAHSKSPCERNRNVGTTELVEASCSNWITSVAPLLPGKTNKGSASHWDYNNIPENLSPKPLSCDVDAAAVPSGDSTKRPLMKQSMMSNMSKEGQGLARLANNIQEGSSGIPIGIARALQRTIPQPTLVVSVGESGNVLLDDRISPERPKATDSSNPHSNASSSDKPGLLCAQSLAATVTETDKQSCWKNESRPHVFSSSFNNAWLQGVPPTTLSASINPAAAVWVGQFPSFHHHALLPYASTSIGRNQSQQRFHPASGFKLAQDSITGQFFFIPVPDMSWPNLGSCVFPDPNAQQASQDIEPSSIIDNTSPVTNYSKLEVQTDTNIFTETVQVSNESSVPHPTDLSINGLQLKTDNGCLAEGVDVGRIGQFPIIFPSARPPYFVCDSQLFLQDPHRQKERPRVCVESRGTSPIQRHLDLESTGETALADKNVLKNAESKRGKDEHEKLTLNASVQTNQSLSLTQSPDKACTAEISIQTSDMSDTESVSSESFIREKRNKFKLRKQTILCNLKLIDSALGQCEESCLKSSIKQASLIIPTVKDAALSDISSDEMDSNLKPIPSCQNFLPKIPLRAMVLDERKSHEIDNNQPNIAIDSCDRNDVLLKPVSQKSVYEILKTCTSTSKSARKDSTSFFDLVQAVTAELSSCAEDQASREVQESTLKSGSGQDLDDLVMLSMIASTQLPATPSNTFSHQESKEAGNCGITSVRKFNIFDLNISQFIESEHSPDVSTSYNVPKSCFFSDMEFPSSSKSYPRYSKSEEPRMDDLTLGILKSDEGPENMDPMELDLRMKMAEVQMKYKQEQKELARLQRKNNELRNNNNANRKKSKRRQSVQRKQSTSKQLYISSDDNSDSTDSEESGQESIKKNRNSKSDVKLTATSVHSASNFKHEFNGIKIKVSNPQKKTSSTLLSSTSAHFQRSLKTPFVKDRRHSCDSRRKEMHHGKPFVTPDKQEELKLTTDRARSVSSSAAEDCLSTLEMKKCKLEQPQKLNMITEDAVLKKKPKQFCFYSYKKNKTTSNNKEIMKHKLQITDPKSITKDKFTSKVKVGNRKIVDDEWYRRRSERIFLHEASAGSISSPTAPGQMSFGDERSLPLSPSKPSMKPTRTLSQESGLKTLSNYHKSELSVTLKTCLSNNTQTCASKKPTASDSSDTDTNSDTDDVPLSALVHKESSVEIRSCMIGKDELADNLRVLYLKDEHFYEGTVKAVLPPDVYRVIIDGERSSRQEVVSQEELLQKAILNIRPTSKGQLPEGSRICAYWSQKFSCLYPGTIRRSLGESFDDKDENTVHVEFDDGDSGTIPLTHISMLPPGYEIQESETSSALMPGNRKRRNTADDPVGVNVLQRPSAISRSMSVMDSPSYRQISDDTTLDSSSEMKQSSLIRQASNGGRPSSHASNSLEKKSKNEKQEYSCRLKTESGGDRVSTDFSFGPVGKKSSQKKVDGISSSEKDNFIMSDFMSDDQKKSNLTLTIKRETSREHETSASSTDEDDDMTSDENEALKSNKRHLKHKKMKLEEMDHTSTSDAGETSSLETSRKKGQKRKRRSSYKSTKDRRHHQSSSESGDQIGAFRPVWEQWQWYGPCTRRPGMKGKAKKQFYRAIQRGSEILKIGDAAVFVSMGHNDLQYVGCIDSLWESWDGNMFVKVKWFYHPEETKGGKRLLEIKSALYQSSHEDENDVQTVSHKCEVLSYTNLKKFQAKKYSVDCKPEDVFYLAGTYDPTIGMITYQPDVPLKSH